MRIHVYCEYMDTKDMRIHAYCEYMDTREVFTLPLVFRPESHLSPGILQDSSRNLTFHQIVDGI